MKHISASLHCLQQTSSVIKTKAKSSRAMSTTFLVLSVPHPNFSTISEMDRRFVTFIGQGCDVTRSLWRANTGQITGSKASEKMAPSLISFAHNETRRRQKRADSLHAKLNYGFRRYSYRLHESAFTTAVTRHRQAGKSEALNSRL
jgi:hypothetical protein